MSAALIQEKQVFYCFSDCGVCESECPVTHQDPSFSPRRIVMQSVLGDTRELLEGEDIWRCLSCGNCSFHCPARVDFLGLIRELRAEALERKAGSGRERTTHERMSREPA